jgi:alpha-galactosidase
MADVCSDALLLNYANPMAILVKAVHQGVWLPVVGMCHSVYWTVHTLAGYLGLPFEEVDAVSGGVNHLAWILRLEHRGKDLYPALRSFVESGGVPEDDLVRAELFRRFGLYPTESSEHHAEYSPWFISKNKVESLHIPIGEYLARVAHNQAEFAETKRLLDAGAPFEIEQSGEYAPVIVHAMATGEPARIVANVLNDATEAGSAQSGPLIPNLALDACVEVPAMVDRLGVHPIGTGPLPLQCAAYTHPAVDCQLLTVAAALEKSRDLVHHAVLTDPQVQAGLSLDEAWRLTDELIAAEAEWLPAWLGGTAPNWTD